MDSVVPAAVVRTYTAPVAVHTDGALLARCGQANE